MIVFDGVGQFLDPVSGVIESVLLLKGSQSNQTVRLVIRDEDVKDVVDLFTMEGPAEEVDELAEERPVAMAIQPTDAGTLPLSGEYEGQPIAQPFGAGGTMNAGEGITELDAVALENAAFGEIGEL